MSNETTLPAVRAFEDDYKLQLAQVSTMARAGVLPACMANKPDLAVLAMRTCARLNLGWETHLRYFYEIDGALCVWGDLTRQLVERTGEVAGEERYFQWFADGEWHRCEEWEVGMRFNHANAPDSLTAIVKVWRRNREKPYVGHFSAGDARSRISRKGTALWDRQQYKSSPGFVVKMGWNAEHMAKRRGFPDCYDGIVAAEEMEDAVAPRDAEYTTVDKLLGRTPAEVVAERVESAAALDIDPREPVSVAQEPPAEPPANRAATTEHEIDCQACDGTGSVGKRAEDCPTCGGKGKIKSPVADGDAPW